MLRDKSLITALQACKSLAHLYVSFDYQWTDEEEQSLNCSIPVSGFRNLTSLELYNIGGREADEIEGISAALSSSPHLRKLGLGLGWRADCEGTPESCSSEVKATFCLISAHDTMLWESHL